MLDKESIVEVLCVFVGMIILSVAFIGVIGTAMYPINKASCHASWKDSGYNSTYSFFGGCRIETEEGIWVPTENYRPIKEVK